MITNTISLIVRSTGTDLTLACRFDDQEFYQGIPTAESQTITYEFSDDKECEHLLEIELQGKLPRHTKINENGDILEDQVIIIDDILIDEISLKNFIPEITEYHHDFNGTQESLIDSFYGIMGCNGKVKFHFSSPVYVWLLEII